MHKIVKDKIQTVNTVQRKNKIGKAEQDRTKKKKKPMQTFTQKSNKYEI